ncbi:MAG TPA: glycosyltransferase family 2 protein [Acidimicrobiales bacterium]|nr:glycosyltransferase family 2 protein [Acidimicrobiales bacterium]
MAEPGSGTVSVVICTYTERRWEELVAAVASASEQTRPPLEVIVVVDHNPALRNRAGAAFEQAQVVVNDQPQGLSGARNSGLAVARGDIVAFLDDDAVAEADWLEHLSAPYRDPRVLGVGGQVEPRWVEGRPPGFPAEFDWVVGCSYRGLRATTGPVRNLIGANMSFRRQVFAAVGTFRLGMGRVGTRPAGCEETELCLRASRHWPDGLFIHEPAARVAHRVPAERGRWRYFGARCWAEGLSKAAVCQLAGAGPGLASERAYVLQALPLGVIRGMADTVRHGDLAGLTRGAAITAGVALTTGGYLTGTASARLGRHRPLVHNQGEHR